MLCSTRYEFASEWLQQAKEEQAATQAKMMELRKVVEEKADVEEVCLVTKEH